MPFDGALEQQTTHKPQFLAMLQRARQLIANGWTQNHLWTSIGNSDLRFCIVGAYRAAYEEAVGREADGEFIDSLFAPWLRDQLPRRARLRYWLRRRDAKALMKYNDSALRRKADVLALYDRTIAAEQTRILLTADKLGEGNLDPVQIAPQMTQPDTPTLAPSMHE